MKSKKQKNETGANQELRRLGMLMEHVDSKVSLVAEQCGDIKKDIGSIKKTLDNYTEMIGDLAVNMTTVKRDVEIMKTDIEFIKSGLKKKVDVDEFSALEKRVLILEKHR